MKTSDYMSMHNIEKDVANQEYPGFPAGFKT